MFHNLLLMQKQKTFIKSKIYNFINNNHLIVLTNEKLHQIFSKKSIMQLLFFEISLTICSHIFTFTCWRKCFPFVCRKQVTIYRDNEFDQNIATNPTQIQLNSNYYDCKVLIQLISESKNANSLYNISEIKIYYILQK